MTHTETAATASQVESRPLLPWLALVSVYIIWGSTYLAIRVAVAGEPPFAVAAFRYIVAGILLLLLAARKTAAPRLDLAICGRATLVALLLLVGGNGLLSLGERRVPAGPAALLVATVPLWLVLLNAVRTRAFPTIRVVAALPIGITGVGVLVRAGTGGLNTTGAALVGVAALSWALGSLAARDFALPASMRISGVEMLAGGLLLALTSAAAGEWKHLSLHALRWQELLALFWLVVPGSLVGFSAYTYALRHLPLSTVGTYAYVNPLVAIASAALILGEPINLHTILATALVVTAVALSVSATSPARNTPSLRRAD